jgi:hypothetical protein
MHESMEGRGRLCLEHSVEIMQERLSAKLAKFFIIKSISCFPFAAFAPDRHGWR